MNSTLARWPLELPGDAGSEDLRFWSIDQGVSVVVRTKRGLLSLSQLSEERLREVTRLSLVGGLGWEVVADCLAWTGWSCLADLCMDGNNLRPFQRSLVPEGGNLYTLQTQGDEKIFEGLSALPALSRLWVCENRLGAGGAQRISALSQLKRLEIRGNELGDEGVRKLSSMTGLERLNLARNQVSSEGLRPLLALTALRVLDLEGNPLDHAALHVLEAMTGLERLCLRGTGLAKALGRLQASLPGCRITG